MWRNEEWKPKPGMSARLPALCVYIKILPVAAKDTGIDSYQYSQKNVFVLLLYSPVSCTTALTARP